MRTIAALSYPLLISAIAFQFACTPEPTSKSDGYSKFFGPAEDDIILTKAMENPGQGVHAIEIAGMHFKPENLTVNSGDTVVWTNKDIFAHDVTEQPSGKWSSSRMEPGTSWAMIVNEPANYFCSIHVVMKGKITVTGKPLTQN